MSFDVNEIQKLNTAKNVFDFLIDPLGFEKLYENLSVEPIENVDGKKILVHGKNRVLFRLNVLSDQDNSFTKVKQYLKRHGSYDEELFNIYVFSEKPNEGLQAQIDSELTFLRVEDRFASDSADIQHDLKFFTVNTQDFKPVFFDVLSELTVDGKSISQLSETVEDVFSVKQITKRFYAEFKEIFQGILKDSVQGIDDDDILNSYVQLLVNRLLFLMFVQEKGWLDEDDHYLQNKFVEARENELDLFKDVFRPLFFQALNNPEKNNYEFLGRIPYLNGGLFEEKEIEKNVYVKDDFFDALLNPEENEKGYKKGFLLRYKISLSENNPSEQELVVDPEFIGRIFEMFMQEKERSDKGAFYTPKEITEYMCKKSLIYRLLNKFEHLDDEITLLVGEHQIDEDLNLENIGEIRNKLDSIRVLDPAVGSGAFVISMLEELVSIISVLNDEIGDETDLFLLKEKVIARNIYGVDIDPRGIELCKFRTWLNLIKDLHLSLDELLEENSRYALPNLDFKFFVGNSLAGDFEPTKLFEKGNQDLFLYDKSKGHLLHRIEGIREKYINAHGDDKKKFEKKLLKLTNELDRNVNWEQSEHWMNEVVEKAGTSFKWSINIPEVILNGGFDIVIGNPPYKGGSNESYVGELSKFYAENVKEYVKPVRKMVYDLYQKFIFRGHELVKEEGILAYITSSTFFTIGTKTATRKLLQSNNLKELLTANPDTFDAAVEPAIFLMRKLNCTNKSYSMSFINGYEAPISAYRRLLNFVNFQKVDVLQSTVNLNVYQTDIEIFRNSIRSSFFEPKELNLQIYNQYIKKITKLLDDWRDELIDVDAQKENLDQIREKHLSNLKKGDVTLLGLLTWGGEGLKTNNNEEHLAYLEGTIAAEKVKQRNESSFYYRKKNEKKFSSISRVIRKNDLAKLDSLDKQELENGINSSAKTWVPYEKGATMNDIYYKNIQTYIDWSTESLQKINNRSGGRLRDPSYYFRKGLFASRGGTGYSKVRYVENAVIDSSGVVLIPTFDIMSAKVLLGLLNSKIIKFIVDQFINHTVNTQVADMRLIPIKIPSERNSNKLESLVEKAINVKKGNSNRDIGNIQKDIDNLTQQIYGINLDDI